MEEEWIKKYIKKIRGRREIRGRMDKKNMRKGDMEGRLRKVYGCSQREGKKGREGGWMRRRMAEGREI